MKIMAAQPTSIISRRPERPGRPNRTTARRDGTGPLGTVHPEYDGLITWGRLEGGGYLCWVPLPQGDSFRWPVVVLDATLRRSVTFKMSASRFLLELATHPERVPLPPAG